MEERSIFKVQDTFAEFELTCGEDGEYFVSMETRDIDGDVDITCIDLTRDQLHKLYKALINEFFFKGNLTILPSNDVKYSVDVANLPVGIFPSTESKIEYLNATMRITDAEAEAINKIIKKQKEDERKRGSQS